MFEIGRLCVKIAGRDAGRKCVIVDEADKNLVMIDGDVRRRKCNPVHLEPLDQVLKIKKGASSEEVKKEFEKLGLASWSTKPKKAGEKPHRLRSVDRKKAEAPEKKAPSPKPAPAEKPKKEDK